MKAWYEHLFDLLAGLLSKTRLKKSGAGSNDPSMTVTIPLPAFGGSQMTDEAKKRYELIAFARSQLGKPYKFGVEVVPGHEADASDWDCSEIIQLAYLRTGMSIPDGAINQYQATQVVRNAIAGDLGFLWSDKRNMIGHVMMATGDETVIHAVAGRGVVEDPISMWNGHPRWRGWRRHIDFARPVEERI